jgi:hypothetical protein
MHEELENFEMNQVWELVDPPPGSKLIGTKWVWKNKEGEKGEVVRNKSRLVAQGFNQKEGINYKDIFALVARLNGYEEDDQQPSGFESEKYPHRVYKLRKALYGLKQAPRA